MKPKIAVGDTVRILIPPFPDMCGLVGAAGVVEVVDNQDCLYVRTGDGQPPWWYSAADVEKLDDAGTKVAAETLAKADVEVAAAFVEEGPIVGWDFRARLENFDGPRVIQEMQDAGADYGHLALPISGKRRQSMSFVNSKFRVAAAAVGVAILTSDESYELAKRGTPKVSEHRAEFVDTFGGEKWFSITRLTGQALGFDEMERLAAEVKRLTEWRRPYVVRIGRL